jgi:hypothetical protein
MVTRYENEQWTTPARASFSNYQSGCPALADNDQSIYFSRGGSISKATRTANGWSSPIRVNQPVSSSQSDWTCHVSNLGNLWLCSHRSGGVGVCDLWTIQSENGRFTQAQNLRTLNTSNNDCDPAPGPNEDYVIWMSGKPGGFGGNDLYISFADYQGGWTAPRNLGPAINTSNGESAAFISPDHKYLFFTRDSSNDSDIYWVSLKAVLPDPNGPIQNLNSVQRFSSIQSAVNYANDGDTIVINPGVYQESIVLTNKSVLLQSVDPNDPTCIGGTIIQGSADSPIITLQENPAACEIAGLTIRAGSIGIKGTGTNATIRNCRIMDNTTHGLELSQASSPNLQHCLITSNGQTGITMLAGPGRSKCKPNIENCIIVYNGQSDIVGGEPTIIDSIVSQ